MLFRLGDQHRSLTPVEFLDFGDDDKLEKDLENLIATHLFGTLFEEMRLLAFHQERKRQSEADIYAVNMAGEVVIFELKRGMAGSSALEQLLRYAEDAGRWTYVDLARKYQAYDNKEFKNSDLQEAHREGFNLEAPLPKSKFNSNQILVVIGSAADRDLIQSVEYWRRKGIAIDFLPYRLYRIGKETFFEFFAKPYDEHINPSETKGVLFDTNRSWDDDPNRVKSFKSMLAKKRIAAYGDRKDAVRSLAKGDYVFYYHGGFGIVAAAIVIGQQVKKDGDDELYWDVKFLTPTPKDLLDPPAMGIQQLSAATGKTFFLARIDKRPYLSKEEAEHLAAELRSILREGT